MDKIVQAITVTIAIFCLYIWFWNVETKSRWSRVAGSVGIALLGVSLISLVNRVY